MGSPPCDAQASASSRWPAREPLRRTALDQRQGLQRLDRGARKDRPQDVARMLQQGAAGIGHGIGDAMGALEQFAAPDQHGDRIDPGIGRWMTVGCAHAGAPFASMDVAGALGSQGAFLRDLAALRQCESTASMPHLSGRSGRRINALQTSTR
jgi:hypothetical protein